MFIQLEFTAETNQSASKNAESEFNDKRITFSYRGCKRSMSRLTRAMEGIDVVFHAAASKTCAGCWI